MFLTSPQVTMCWTKAHGVAAADLDLPVSGRSFNALAMPIEGWVVGGASRAVAVEVIAGGLRRRTPVWIERGDATSVQATGFRTAVDLSGISGESVALHVSFASGARAPLAIIETPRFWQASRSAAERDCVSIVIACYNQGRFLADAIESCLRQTHPCVEIVVVDDGSTDESGAIAHHYAGRSAIRYVCQRNGGVASARNTGIRESIGDLVIFLDADDRLMPEAASRGHEYLRKHRDRAFVSGEHRYIDEAGSVIREWSGPARQRDHYAEMLKKNYIGCPAAVVDRRAALRAAGGFDPRFTVCEDYDLYLRMARRFPIGAYSDLVAEYRRHGASVSRDRGRMLRGALAALHAQWPYVRRDQHLETAYRQGCEFWASYYGSTSDPMA